MHYPWWYVPYLTAPMLIGIVAVVHVLVSHYAVGGGLFLAVETGYAYRTGNKDYLAYLRRHARFFVLLTVVFGAITGVGIWWTIGLASPLATGVLIRTFVFGWAIEYVFFILEIVSAFIFYYYWGRLSPRIHTIIVWIYGLSAWISLVLITAITAFMLDPGHADPGHPLQDRNFWSAMLNPQTLPQIVARTGGALLLSSLYVYLHAAITLRQRRFAQAHRIALDPAGAAGGGDGHGRRGGLVLVPARRRPRRPCIRPACLNVLMARDLRGHGGGLRALVPGAVSQSGLDPVAGLRRRAAAVRRCRLQHRRVHPRGGPQALRRLQRRAGQPDHGRRRRRGTQPPAAERLSRQRRLDPGLRPPALSPGHVEPRGDRALRHWDAAEKYAAAQAAILQAGEHADSQRCSTSGKDRVALGAVIFQYHCNDCHAIGLGYSAAGPLVQGWTPDMLRALVRDLDRVHFTMPPWSGTAEEAELVAEYLQSIAPPKPKGMLPGAKRP